MAGTESRQPKPGLLVLASTYPRWPGDPEPGFVHELAMRLTGDFDVRVLCPRAPGAKAREDLDGVDVVRFRYAPRRLETLVNDGGMLGNLRRSPWKLLLLPTFALGLLVAARRHMAASRPAVVHAHWLIPQGLLAVWAKTGMAAPPPILVTSHGADLFALRGAFFDVCRKYVMSRVDHVTVVSAAMRDRLLALGGSGEAISVASMGVDFQSRFIGDATAPRSATDLLFVGRLVEKKGLRFLIEAMPAIVAAFPAVTLTVVGFGPEDEPLRAQVAALGLQDTVDFVGALPQSALPTRYRQAALFVAPFVEAASGDQEGLGLVALEASGCGCPVVVTDIPATRDVFADRIRAGSAEALADAIIAQLRATPAARAATAATQRARLVDRYDWQAVTRSYAALLGRLAAESRGRA